MTPGEWSEQDAALARRLWDEGLPAAEIARRIGRSKSAFCGFRKRRGWPERGSPVQLAPAETAARAAKVRMALKMRQALGAAVVAEARKRAAKPKPVIVPPPPMPSPAPAIVYGRCEFILGGEDKRAWRKCDAPTVGFGPYCAEHRAVCYLKPGTRAWMLEQQA